MQDPVEIASSISKTERSNMQDLFSDSTSRNGSNLLSVLCLLFLIPLPAVAEVLHGRDENDLQSWELRQGALSLKLIQRTPDQTRAFFLARGFPRETANEIATACVLQTIGRNLGGTEKPVSLGYDLHDWRVRYKGELRPIRLKEDWAEAWKSHPEIPEAARIAFRWATFPTRQQFEPGGDYNWGMTSFGLPPGSRFDLQLRWRENGQPQSAWIKNLQCPQDLP